jgi:hypothetical protein
MGKRLWSALFVYLGFAGSAQALPITLSLPVAITDLSHWQDNPYSPPNDLQVGDVGTLTYAFSKDDIVVESLAAGEVVFSVAPWSFQASFPGAALPGAGNGGAFAVLRIRMTDGAVDTLLVDAVEDDFSFHTLLLVDPTGTAFSAADLSAPGSWLASLDAGPLFEEASWRLETPPGAVAVADSAIPEPTGALLMAVGLVAVQIVLPKRRLER